MKNSLKITILLVFISSVFQLESLTLEECLKAAKNSHPLINNAKYTDSISSLKIRNINSVWNPEMTINANLSYQSEVADLSGIGKNLPQGLSLNFPSVSNEQYKVTYDIKQLIWDGGFSSINAKIEKEEQKLQYISNEMSIYSIKQIISDIYINILLIDNSISINKIFVESLEERLSVAKTAIDAGAAEEINLVHINAEKLNIVTQIENSYKLKNTLIKQLNVLTLSNYNNDTKFELPENLTLNKQNNRIELEYFNESKEKMELSKDIFSSKLKPKVIAQAQLGWGKPVGNNFFSDEPDIYYSLGAGLQWNFFDWNKTKREKEIIEVNKHLIDNKSNEFERNISIALMGIENEIEQTQKLIETGEVLIKMREDITANALLKMQNGTLLTTDYLNEFNKERVTKIDYEINKIKLIKSKINYLIISGNYR